VPFANVIKMETICLSYIISKT